MSSDEPAVQPDMQISPVLNFKGQVIVGDVVVLSFCVEPSGKCLGYTQQPRKEVLASLTFVSTPETIEGDMRAVIESANTQAIEDEFNAPDEDGYVIAEDWGVPPYFFFDIEYASPTISHFAHDAYDKILS